MPINEIQLHDIKPLIEIQEYSFYYFMGLVSLAIVVLLGLLYLLYKWFRNRNKFNIRAENFKRLKGIDFSSAKESAYKITLYGATFKEDSERHTKVYEELVSLLEEYKYKKEVAALSDAVKHKYEIYLGLIDV
jgi:hypothetical protein